MLVCNSLAIYSRGSGNPGVDMKHYHWNPVACISQDSGKDIYLLILFRTFITHSFYMVHLHVSIMDGMIWLCAPMLQMNIGKKNYSFTSSHNAEVHVAYVCKVFKAKCFPDFQSRCIISVILVFNTH